MRIIRNSKLARLLLPDRFEAFTFGSTVYVKGGTPALGLIVHEAAHVEQFARHGRLGFVLRYAWNQIRRGYERNRLELEARARVREVESWPKDRIYAWLLSL